MATKDQIDRRQAMGTMAGITVGLAAGMQTAAAQPPDSQGRLALKGRLKHSVCRWCYGKMPLEDLCRNAAAMGLHSVELLGPDEWPVAKAQGLTCAVATNVKSNPIPRGFNRLENHDAIVRDLEERLPLVAAASLPCQIVFSGNRAGLPDSEGAANCIKGLKRITPLAEKIGVTLVMELLNSKDHADYQCDFTRWGVQVVEGVASDRFRLLYDIYHMQRMEGEIIETIQKNLPHIAHFHTGGVPGRAEIDETQELNYAAICGAIADAGFKGYIAQEFIPRRDPMASLRRAVEICDV
ncbi:hydroxypyruvate isomerase [Phycisphaerales bacterium]|nr:hydroxypyruvate isomerase [Phycisphaerales bacterium]